jgi:hypothetical protein
VDRAGPPEALDSHSADNAREDDNLCQKSELAIGETQTSNFQKRLDGVLLGVVRTGKEAKQKCIKASCIGKRTHFPNSDPSKKDSEKARELHSVNFS